MEDCKMTLGDVTDFTPKFDSQGLIPVIAVDAFSGEVLMMAWMNREALDKTLATGEAHYWSRSRQELWRKGETSGNTQSVQKILVDCDQDTLILDIVQNGSGACHTGEKSCFHRILEKDGKTLRRTKSE